MTLHPVTQYGGLTERAATQIRHYMVVDKMCKEFLPYVSARLSCAPHRGARRSKIRVADWQPIQQEDALYCPHSQRRFTREPRWQTAQQAPRSVLPPQTRAWLLDHGSLTERLSSLGTFRVKRLYQGWQRPLTSERRLLSQPTRRMALVREVLLLVDDVPVVFARSVFPVTSLTGRLTHLRQLQNTSLGAILFSHPSMRRSPFEVARLDGNSGYLPITQRQSSPAWGRRSRFQIMGKDLMVSEVFLENFSPWAGQLTAQRHQRGKIRTAL